MSARHPAQETPSKKHPAQQEGLLSVWWVSCTTRRTPTWKLGTFWMGVLCCLSGLKPSFFSMFVVLLAGSVGLNRSYAATQLLGCASCSISHKKKASPGSSKWPNYKVCAVTILKVKWPKPMKRSLWMAWCCVFIGEWGLTIILHISTYTNISLRFHQPPTHLINHL